MHEDIYYIYRERRIRRRRRIISTHTPPITYLLKKHNYESEREDKKTKTEKLSNIRLD